MNGIDRLSRLLRAALVQITVRHSAGSGVFAAPGLVLTCAHVVAAGAGGPVTVGWTGQKYTAKVRYASSPAAGGLWTYPDLAVLELDQPPDGHPCAWLDQRWPAINGQLLALGYSDVYQAGAAPHPALVTYDGPRRHGDGEMLLLAGREIAAGMSGGPVLNTVTGGVCGLLKATRLENAPMGGLAVPVRALRRADPALYRQLVRAHDRHHAAGTDWVEAADDLVTTRPGEIEPAEERSLRGLLADLPVADDHVARVLRAAGPLCQPGVDEVLVDHADVVTDLSEMNTRQDGRDLPYILAYAADLARDHADAAGSALRDWVLVTAGRLRLGGAAKARLDGPAPPPGPTSVMVRLRPAGNDHNRYRLTVWRYAGAGSIVPVVDDQVAVPLAEAWQRLRELLPQQLAALAQLRTRVLVELFLPQDLMDADVERWRLWPTQPWSTLGRRHAVLVRDAARLDDGRVRFVWERRWDKLSDQSLAAALEFVECADARSHEELEGWIEPAEARSALVFAHSPVGSRSRAALEVGMPAGIPVMIWRRSGCAGCADPVGDGCTGRRFFTGLRTALAGIALADLPERVRALRNDATQAGDEDHCGHGIVVLCDDPRRRPPLDRMVLPEERRANG